ncbi:hypothetical protein TP2_08010 [Thioclava pacifica DSM 10166]|uniref:Dihydroorotate dehydrogenase n=2 Tax=Thioclava pacifica TaxID=285109 RepID=A0A074JAJ2_9RHOB|nr:hypothetical protein TP2_08010 [Thioclava pacifica DSM 10166]
MAMSDKRVYRETDGRSEEALLEAVFADARAQAPEPGADFLARVMADAAAVQAGFAAPVAASGDDGPGVLAGIWEALRGAFGGWAPMGGLVTAALAGVWIGFVGAEDVASFSALYGSTTESLGTVNLMPEGEAFAFVDEGGF